MEEIVNKVSQSSLITLDLEDFIPNRSQILRLDINDALDQGIILREKDYRAWLKEHITDSDTQYIFIQDQTDAILPKWALMLAQSVALRSDKHVCFGDENNCLEQLISTNLEEWFKEQKLDKAKVVIKGCSKYDLSLGLYAKLIKIAAPYCSSIMYGEACSTVPLYKAK